MKDGKDYLWFPQFATSIAPCSHMAAYVSQSHAANMLTVYGVLPRRMSQPDPRRNLLRPHARRCENGVRWGYTERFTMRNTDAKTFAVTVTVDGKSWQLVPGLASSGPRAREFTIVRTAGGKTLVQFGDGVHGARPPAGSKITVDYRSGGGARGNTTSVVLQRAATDPTVDQALWVVIRNRGRAISFEFRELRGPAA